MLRLERGRIRQLLEVVLVGAVINIHFRLKILAASRTVLPSPVVTLSVMLATESQSSVIASTTVAGVREELVLALIVADPLAATLGFGEFVGRTTEPAATRSNFFDFTR